MTGGQVLDFERYFRTFMPYDFFYTSPAELYLGLDRRSPWASGGSGDALRQIRALVAVLRCAAPAAVGGSSPGAESADRGVDQG